MSLGTVVETTPTAVPQLWGPTGEDLPISAIQKGGTDLCTTDCKLYQVIQETAAGPKFLTSWDTMEAAMRDCRTLNVCTGDAFKTVVWGTGTPCIRCSKESREFKADNVIPSLLYTPAAVKGYPEAYPVSAVYNHGTEVIFLPDGSHANTQLADFSIGFSPIEKTAKNQPKMLYRAALRSARDLSKVSGRRTYVTTRSRKPGSRRSYAVAQVHPIPRGALGELSPWGSPPGKVASINPIVTQVTPEDLAQLLERSQQYSNVRVVGTPGTPTAPIPSQACLFTR